MFERKQIMEMGEGGKKERKIIQGMFVYCFSKPFFFFFF